MSEKTSAAGRPAPSGGVPAFAMTFPGQGSQSVGMLAALAVAFAQVEETFAEASEVLGYDLWALTQEGPESALARTVHTQPAMLSAGVAVWRVWCAAGGPRPDVALGHSLGEYSALVCAEAIGFADAVRVVAARGRFMQEAVPDGEGAIAAILGLSDAEVEAICAEAAEGRVVQAVNFNAPGQVAIAGHADAVERAIVLARSRGARRAVPIAMSVPSHCRLMRPAADRLREVLDATPVKRPSLAVINNVDVAVYEDPSRIRDALVRQVYNPVRWVEAVRAARARGVVTAVESGPGRVLSGLNKRIEKDMQTFTVHDPATLEGALRALTQAPP